jgi:hypothetical protein
MDKDRLLNGVETFAKYEFNRGYCCGEAAGYQSGVKAGRAEGSSKAEQSWQAGYDDGYNQGLATAEKAKDQKSLTEFLARFGIKYVNADTFDGDNHELRIVLACGSTLQLRAKL